MAHKTTWKLGKTENAIFDNTISYVDSVLAGLASGNIGGTGNTGTSENSSDEENKSESESSEESSNEESSSEEEIVLSKIADLMSKPASDTNQTVEDEYGNKIVIPSGFTVVAHGTNGVVYDYTGESTSPAVQDGIVVQDSEENQFVWVPVGEITNNDGTITNIQLGRYEDFTMGTNGTLPTPAQTAANWETDTVISSNFYEYAENASYENTKAKDLEGFLTSTTSNGGYYLARYEASYRDGTKPWSKASTGTPATSSSTVKTNGMLWNYITQLDAATASKAMYTSTDYTSDLVNSYAWDTAIVFIQTYENSDYSKLTSKNTSGVENTGERTDTIDKVCNIYDIASNVCEWTTETSTISDRPCTIRGGYYGAKEHSASNRFLNTTGPTSNNGDSISFRPLLYCSSET